MPITFRRVCRAVLRCSARFLFFSFFSLSQSPEMTEGRETSQSLPFHSRPPRSHHAFVACLEGAGSRHTYLLYVSRRSLFIYPRPVQRCADTLLYSALLCSISGCASAVAGWLLVGCCTKACFGGGLGGNTIERGGSRIIRTPTSFGPVRTRARYMAPVGMYCM